MEADGQKAGGNEGDGSAHQIALEWAFINLARRRYEIISSTIITAQNDHFCRLQNTL
jgi:hypothetical protein